MEGIGSGTDGANEENCEMTDDYEGTERLLDEMIDVQKRIAFTLARPAISKAKTFQHVTAAASAQRSMTGTSRPATASSSPTDCS